MTMARIELPTKLVDVFALARGELRYRGAFGGRGSGKSRNFAMMAAVWGYAEKLRILCTRQFHVSIRESFFLELVACIESTPWMSAHYTVGATSITGANGTEFIFRGLDRNVGNIRSLSNIDLCIIEEAEDISEHSLDQLEPTIRAEKSEIWLLWNPKRENSPVDVRFRKHEAPRAIIVEMNYHDNPWFPSVLREKMEYDLRRDPGRHAHIWLGDYLKNSELQVFRNWRMEEFEAPKDAMFRYGADWGFSVDPTVLVRCYAVGQTMYVDYEAYEIGCEITRLPDLFATVPESEKWPITADSARPETISHLRNHGFPKIMGAVKGAKSVEEGVEWLKSFDIVVHPRCKNTIDELTLYSYKEDEAGRPTNILKDKNNHVIDALRYACEGARRIHTPPQVVYVPLPNVSYW